MNDTNDSEPKTAPPKPRAETIRSEITRLPELTASRWRFRKFFSWSLRQLARIFIQLELSGLENVPNTGPAIVVSNHLGDIDPLLGWAFSPRLDIDVILKAELHDIPILGQLMNSYGVIWVHRGQPDRNTIRAAIQGLSVGRMIGIAPEGRESLIGGLEEGTHGAAYLALKADVPLVPITFTCTENARVYKNLIRFRRTKVTMTIGPMFRLDIGENRRAAIDAGTLKIMLTLAHQLPMEYRGVYSDQTEQMNGS